MALWEESNNFLPRNEVEKTIYNRRKPVIIFVMVMFLVFNVVGCIVQGVAIAYASWSYQPVEIDQVKYQAAQKLNNELSQRFGQLKLARPKDVNVIAALAAVTNAKPSEVSLSEINITPDKTVITGVTQNLDLANQYCNGIIIKGKKTLLDTVKEDKENKDSMGAVSTAKDIRFTISVIENTKAEGGGNK